MIADDKPRRRTVSDEERALWRTVTRSVSPLRRNRRKDKEDAPAGALPVMEPKILGQKPVRGATVPPSHTSPSPHAGERKGGGPPQSPALAPLDRRARQRLARGTEAIDARLDLHGRTQSEAHAALVRFLRKAQAGGARTVLVITGKGGDASRERGVLKRQVPLWLGLPEFRSLVVGYSPAAIGHGGEGALYVRVRRPR